MNESGKCYLQRMIQSTEVFVTPNDIAPIIGSHPATIRDSAKLHPELIGFPFMFCGSTMKIPRIPFLNFLGIEKKRNADTGGNP